MFMPDRPNDPTRDPIADLATLASGRPLFSSVFVAGGPWSIRFVPHSTSIKFGIVLDGRCWLQPDGLPARRLETNDAFFLTNRRPYRLASDLELDALEWDGSLRIGKIASVQIAGGRFVFEGTGTQQLLTQLSPAMFAVAGSDVAIVVQWVLERCRSEMNADRPARTHMSALLSNILLVQLLRLHSESVAIREDPVEAFADAYVNAALRSIHQDPLRRRTVAQFASDVGLSRSSFAARFRQIVGISPYAYVLRQRMHVAERELQAGDATIAGIARMLGYESESAFSAAFKRTTGLRPARYRAHWRSSTRR